MFFKLEIDEEGSYCPLLYQREGKSACGHDDAFDRDTQKDYCRGNLLKRPEWCPLIEIEE